MGKAGPQCSFWTPSSFLSSSLCSALASSAMAPLVDSLGCAPSSKHALSVQQLQLEAPPPHTPSLGLCLCCWTWSHCHLRHCWHVVRTVPPSHPTCFCSHHKKAWGRTSPFKQPRLQQREGGVKAGGEWRLQGGSHLFSSDDVSLEAESLWVRVRQGGLAGC